MSLHVGLHRLFPLGLEQCTGNALYEKNVPLDLSPPQPGNQIILTAGQFIRAKVQEKLQQKS